MTKKVERGEVLSYAFAGLGQNMIYSLSIFFLMYFYNDVFHVKALHVGYIFLGARIWDAVNDLLMASIVENTKTKWGKLRPYLLFAPLPIAILTILTFLAPDITYGLKLVYILVTYVLWGMAYTVADIPYWGLSATLTDDTKERTQIISFTRVMTMIGMGIPIVLVPLIIDLAGNEQRGYLISAITISLIGATLLSLAFFGTKERIPSQEEKASLIGNFKLIFKNIPLIIILLSSVLGFAGNMTQTAGAYVASHIFMDLKLIIVLAGIIMMGIVLAMFLTPKLNQRFTKKKIYIFSGLFGSLMYFLMYILGYQQFTIIIVLLFFSSFSSGFNTVLQTSMIADSVDYLEYKTGKRAEALCFSGQTFVTKLSSALSTMVIAIVLDQVHFIEGGPLDQGELVKNGIFSLVSIIPGIGLLLSTLPMFFYKFTENIQEQCVIEIKNRK